MVKEYLISIISSIIIFLEGLFELLRIMKLEVITNFVTNYPFLDKIFLGLNLVIMVVNAVLFVINFMISGIAYHPCMRTKAVNKMSFSFMNLSVISVLFVMSGIFLNCAVSMTMLIALSPFIALILLTMFFHFVG